MSPIVAALEFGRPTYLGAGAFSMGIETVFFVISQIAAYFTINIIHLATKNTTLVFLKVTWRFIVTSELKSICICSARKEL